MAQLVLKNARLSASGISRINAIQSKLKSVIEAMLENEIPRLQDRIAEFAPTAQEEADLISYPGSAYDFIKDTFIDVQTAIRSEAYFIETIGGVLSVKLGKTADINPLIGFKWFHGSKKTGTSEMRSSDDSVAGDAWKHLLERWEYGGSGPFTVTARDGGNLTIFHPNEDTGILPRNPEAVMKDFPWMPRGMPFAMYQNGSIAFKPTLLKQMREAIRSITL